MIDCATFIRIFEGLRLKAYDDGTGKLTIGIGHTGPDVTADMEISLDRADELLDQDIAKAQSLIKQYIKVPLNDNQLTALTSLVFNLGSAPLEGTLGHLLNNGDYANAALQFGRWIHAGQHILTGLVKRRDAEKKLFLTPMEINNE